MIVWTGYSAPYRLSKEALSSNGTETFTRLNAGIVDGVSALKRKTAIQISLDCCYIST
jgi:hypothetical protein